ncbi:hypothetical protein KBI52_10890 [Microvirga sp. HBU67558]|uniref:hypothetical protein n=1 Tax=Microvirga sp. HBU67558 TaxID=2824562 RepID=UPI001B37900B|nr:hypothetical protein [Microvirga sp. HBU67558]MBQ0820711.1 hypothetical protein [Microvirga sp. HBU67558]
MIETQGKIEDIARTLYDAQDCARGWNREPEQLKQPFRQYAQALTTVLIVAADEISSDDYGEPGGRVAVESEVFQACSAASQTSARLVAQSWHQIRSSRARIAQSRALLRG